MQITIDKAFNPDGSSVVPRQGRGFTSYQKKQKATAGFTLIELMVTISVAAILLSIAIPGFKQLSTRNRITTYTNDFIASINYARSEAVRLGSPVSICKSSDGTSCSGSWSDGWIIFKNPAGHNPASVDSTNQILKKHEGLTSGYTLAGNASVAADITFGADGGANHTGVLAVCHDSSTTGARAVIVTRLRPRVGTDTDNDGIPNSDTGNIASCTNP